MSDDDTVIVPEYGADVEAIYDEMTRKNLFKGWEAPTEQYDEFSAIERKMDELVKMVEDYSCKAVTRGHIESARAAAAEVFEGINAYISTDDGKIVVTYCDTDGSGLFIEKRIDIDPEDD